jgi:aminopeptidase N
MGVLSNMPLATKTPITTTPGRSKWQFLPSFKMSTYLIAYAITDFQMKGIQTKRGLNITVWAAKDKINQVDVALLAAKASIESYEQYYELNFPLPKLDQIAIPNFAAGAMENCQCAHPVLHKLPLHFCRRKLIFALRFCFRFRALQGAW